MAMKRIVGVILATILIMTAGLNYAFAEPVEYDAFLLGAG